MNKGCKHIFEGELAQIEILLSEGYTIPKIATKLGRHKSTLYEMFQDNGIKYGEKRKEYDLNGRKNQWHGKKKVQFKAQTIYDKRRLSKSESSKRCGTTSV